jgi:hypothetical protein
MILSDGFSAKSRRLLGPADAFGHNHVREQQIDPAVFPLPNVQSLRS